VHLLRRIAVLPGVDAIEIDARPGPDAWPANADLLFSLETLIHRLPRSGASSPAQDRDLSAWRPTGHARPDLIVDLCGDVAAAEAGSIWRLSYDGRPGEAGLLAEAAEAVAPGAVHLAQRQPPHAALGRRADRGHLHQTIPEPPPIDPLIGAARHGFAQPRFARHCRPVAAGPK
jgi:hypothetical protein